MKIYSEDEASIYYEDIADYQESLSRILQHITNVSIHHIKTLSKFCILMIKRFPELSLSSQNYALDSLKTTLFNLQSLKIHLTQEFISTIIFDGIVWSCSHSLLIDAELKRDLECLPRRPITYKDYVYFWKGLLNSENYGAVSVAQQIVNEIMETCINLSGKLNINIKTRDENIYSNLALSHIAENESDFRIFLNMVDLYDEILEDIDPYFINDKFPRFLYEIIRASYRHPLHSGFYRIIDRALTVCSYFDKKSSTDTELYNMVLQYLQNTVDKVCLFPHELQISCVQLILRVPKYLILRLIDQVAPVYKIALTIGLNDYDLANSALNALEEYTLFVDSRNLNNLVNELLPSLELYLRSKETLQTDDDSVRGRKKILKNTDEGLEEVQKRILLLFGRLDQTVVSQFLHKQSLDTGSTWDKKDLLKYSLDFPDLSLDVHLDTILPRIIDLALNCSDRRTKVAACEVLHSIIAIVLGKTVQFLSADPDRFASLYKIICPTLLRLGCDPDEVVMRLFNPLTLQITHWLSSKLMLHSPAVCYLIDSLFDGLSDESNFSLRDFSGICLAEFTRWSIKQSTNKELLRAPININTIVENITNFALHPSHRRRVAAAIAFNSLYRILSSNDEIINIFWLELLYCFSESINGCNHPSIWTSLSHIKTVLGKKSGIFNGTNLRRKTPAEFADGTLQSAVNWLFSKCGVLDKSARKKYIELFRELAAHVANYDSAKSIISAYLKNDKQKLNMIILKDLHVPKCTISAENLKILQRSLDCYVWLLRDQLIDTKMLFGKNNPSRNIIFDSIQNFVTVLLNTNMEKKVLIDFRESAKITVLQCETISSLLEFIIEIANIEIPEKTYIHEILFDKNLFTLILRCVLDPKHVGFDMKHLRIIELLPGQLERVFNVTSKKIGNIQMEIMMRQLEEEVEIISSNLGCDEESLNRLIFELPEIKGIILLQKCGILGKLTAGKQILANGVAKITNIFNILIIEDDNNKYFVELECERKLNLENLLTLLLNDKVTVKTIIKEFIENETPLNHNDSATITHGEYFFNTFKGTICRFLMNNMIESIEALTSFLEENADIVFTVMEELVMWLMQHKNEFEQVLEQFTDIIIAEFTKFERAINNFEARKKSFVTIYRVVVRLKQNPLDISTAKGPLYVWILRELTDMSDLSKTSQMLENFLICLVGDDSENFHELRIILGTLKCHRGDGNFFGQVGNSLKSSKAMECFQTLLKLLPNTKSTIVLHATINFATGAAEFLCNNATTAYLNEYFTNIPATRALKSLEETIRLFMDTTLTNERFDILRNFLLPAFKCCSPAIIERFFDRNIREIFSTINKKSPTNAADCEKLYVSQIGCYNLIELLFLNIELEKINKKYEDAAKELLNPTNLTCFVSIKIFRRTFEIRQLTTDIVDHQEILRRLHCAACNCCITIASFVKQENYFLAIFGENKNKDQLLWERIINCRKQYKLAQTFKEFPKKQKRLVNIKHEIKNKQLLDSTIYSYIKSYDVASSTLSDNIFAYDFSEIKLLPQASTPTMSVILEADDLNSHECMAPICGLLKIMSEQNNPDAASQGTREPSKALSTFAGSMGSKHYNVQLYMLKIVLNNQWIFKPFAEKFLPRTIDIIISMLTTGQLNYIITDALLMLIDWAEVATPKYCQTRAQIMFNLLTDKVDVGASTEYIVRYNFSIIGLLVKVWNEWLDIPPGFYLKITENQPRVIPLILIYLSNKLGDKLIRRNDVLEFLLKFLEDNCQEKEDLVLQTCEAIGLFLKFQVSGLLIDQISRESATTKRIRRILEWIQIKNPDRLVKCIHSMSKAYPLLSEIFFEFIMHNHLKITSVNKAKALQVFLLRIPRMAPTEIRQELKFLKFHELLANKDNSCEKVCLEIIEGLVPIFNCTDFFPLADLAAAYSQNDFLEYRELTYKIFMAVYKKYTTDISEDRDSQRLVNMSKRILLPGLLDSSPELQRKLTTFWTEETGFNDKCAERIRDIFELYSADVEKNFLPILSIIFLSLTKKSPSYRKKMFEPLDKSCNFRNYEIAISWRMKNLSYRVPLFASSYASQYSQQFTLSSLASDDLLSTYDGLMLRATQLSQLEQSLTNETYLTDASMRTAQQDDVFVIPELPTKNVLSRRFLDNPKKLYALHKKEQENCLARPSAQKQQAIRQRNSIKLNRSYRIGDFPDIEITHETILDPLQELIKKDQIVCKNLVVLMLCSLLNQMQNRSRIGPRERNQEFMDQFGKQLNYVLENRQGNGLIISAVLEIMFHMEGIKFDTNAVARVSKVTGFNCLGALLLENNLITDRTADLSSPAKKTRRENEPGCSDFFSKTDQWIQLADLYQLTNDVDVIMSIFQNHVPGQEDLLHASAAKVRNKWNEALEAYKVVYQSEVGTVQRYSHQGMFECLGRLSDWGQIIAKLESNIETENKLHHFLDIADSESEGWMSTWFFQAWTYQILTKEGEEKNRQEFLDHLMASLQIPNRVQRLTELFAEEIAVICPIKYHEQSRDFVNSALIKVREQWSQLSPLSFALRGCQLIKLRGICNIDMFRKVAQEPNRIQSTLIQYWLNSTPRTQDDLLPWDRHIAYRLKFQEDLVEHLEASGDSQADEIYAALSSSINKLQLKMIEAAFQQKNVSLMRKHWNYVDEEAIEKHGLYNQLALNSARFRMLRAEVGALSQKLKYYPACWRNAEKVLHHDNIDASTRVATRHLISDLALAIIDINSDDSTLLFEKIDEFIITYKDNFNDHIGGLYSCSFAHLKASCIEALQYSLEKTKIADCHLKLLKFCLKRIPADPANNNVIKEFVQSTLQAMYHGSREASQYFPCLLNSDYFNNDEIKRIFLEASLKVPIWRFLGWHKQLVLHLSSPLKDLVAPLVERLIEQYPNALLYTFRLIVDLNPECQNHPMIGKFSQHLLSQSELDKFFNAMQYLVRPELYLDYHLKKLLDDLPVEKETNVNNLLKLVYPEPVLPVPLQGKLYKYIAKYRQDIRRVKDIPMDDVSNHVNNLRKELQRMLEKQKDSRYLKDYSPWLSQVNGSNIEIPGQYTGDRKPLPEYHTKIMKIESKIQVMKSSRKPIKIIMVGNDAKNYNFLVKFGEDLRLDERVQQAFNIMNEILQTDAACSQRHLSVNTYQVIAVSGSFGLIQWVNNTKTLHDYINFTMSDGQKKNCRSIQEDYEDWIRCASPTAKIAIQYKEASIKYNADAVAEKMKQLEQKMGWDLLRRTFLMLSPSLESFMSLRKNFIITYATMCIAQWILGIGDRHLENTLITVESGKCTAIDFASAFGGGIDQSVPELIPFRLTNQIKGLMKPFDENDGFGATMIHVLRALKNSQRPLIAYLNVVANENLNWNIYIQELSQAIKDEGTGQCTTIFLN